MCQQGEDLKLMREKLDFSPDLNIIVGQSHFIKTVEDIYEIMVTSVPQAKFGVAFCEASGKRLIRAEGNDNDLKASAIQNAQRIGAGHTFVLLLKDSYPINVLPRIKACPEVCTIYCATSNPVEIIILETKQGRGIMGVVDGEPPLGIEAEADISERRSFLRKIGYKR